MDEKKRAENMHGEMTENQAYNDYANFGVDEIRELLGKGQYTRLRQIIAELNDADIADYLEEMEEEEVVKIFRILPKDTAADVFLIWRSTSSSRLLLHCRIRMQAVSLTT